MLIKATKFFQTAKLFLNIYEFICPADDPLTYLLKLLFGKDSSVVPGKRKASVIELVVNNSTNNLASNVNKISVFENNDRFSQTQKIVKLKSTSQKKNCNCCHWIWQLMSRL